MNCKFLVSCLLIFFVLQGAEETQTYHTDVADLETEPSCIVAHVNVVTGAFVDYEKDLTVMGPVPLTFERTKDQSGYAGGLKGGWNHNWTRELKYDTKKKEYHHRHYNVTFTGAFGEEILFDCRKTSDKVVDLPVGPIHYVRGLTNCASGDMSGRTHLKNMSLNLNKKTEECRLRKGDGTEILFKKGKNGYEFHQEILPNQNKITIETKGEEQLVQTFSRTGRALGWLKIFTPKDLKKNPHIVVSGSDGRKVTYSFKRSCPKGSEESNENDIKWSLSGVRRKDGPKIFYTFLNSDITNQGAITSRHHPDGRFLQIDYHRYEEEQRVPPKDEKLKIKKREDHRLNKVMRLRAPLGRDLTACTLYEFVYEKEKKSEFTEKGTTTVFDAAKVKTVYRHENQRLTSIEKYKASKKLFSVERLEWGPAESELNCNLMRRTLEDASGKRIFEKTYVYDEHHNVIEENCFGNLCGNTGWDCLIKRARYCIADLNLPVREDDGEVKTKYLYFPETNLLIRKIQEGKDGLQRRLFMAMTTAASSP